MRSFRIQTACIPGGDFHDAVAEVGLTWADQLGTTTIAALQLDEDHDVTECNYIRMVVNTLVFWCVQAAMQRRNGPWQDDVDQLVGNYVGKLPDAAGPLMQRSISELWPVFNRRFNEASGVATAHRIAETVDTAFESICSTGSTSANSVSMGDLKSKVVHELSQVFADVSEGYDAWSRFDR